VAFVVIYDACVLFPAPLRDLLIRVAQTRLVQAKWTNRILDEMVDNILEQRTDLERSKLERTRALMCDAVRDCLVFAYEDLIEALDLPDPDDRHVLAAAIRCGAQVIVTENIRDFPAETLAKYSIEAQTADEFLDGLLDLSPGRVVEALTSQAAELKNPPMTVDDILATLAQLGLVRFISGVRAFQTGGDLR
jgi:predicted nucleic acid-binding protein